MSVQPMHFDLLGDSVAAFAKSFRREIGSVILVAALALAEWVLCTIATADGRKYHEPTSCRTLLTLLLEKNGAYPLRVVCLSSVMHRFGDPTDWRAPLVFNKKRNTAAVEVGDGGTRGEMPNGKAHSKGIVGIAANPGAVVGWYRGQLPVWLRPARYDPLSNGFSLERGQARERVGRPRRSEGQRWYGVWSRRGSNAWLQRRLQAK